MTPSRTTALHGVLAALVVVLFVLQAGCTATPIPLPFGQDGGYLADYGVGTDAGPAQDLGLDISIYPDAGQADMSASDLCFECALPDGMTDGMTDGAVGDAEAGAPADAQNTDALTDLSVGDTTMGD